MDLYRAAEQGIAALGALLVAHPTAKCFTGVHCQLFYEAWLGAT